MSENRQEMVPVGRRPGWTRYAIAPSGIMNVSGGESNPAEAYRDSRFIVDDYEEDLNVSQITVGGVTYDYVPFGQDDLLPFEVMKRLGENMVTSQCQLFNVQACYGQGVRFVDRDTQADTEDADIRRFCLRNSLHELFLEQVTDMKFFFMARTGSATCYTETGDAAGSTPERWRCCPCSTSTTRWAT